MFTSTDNKKVFKPDWKAIQARYYAKYSKGGKLSEQEEEEADGFAPAPAPGPAPAPAASGAGSSSEAGLPVSPTARRSPRSHVQAAPHKQLHWAIQAV